MWWFFVIFLFVGKLWRCLGIDTQNQFRRNSFPLCTDRKRKSLIHSDGSFLTRDDFKWIRRHDGSMEYRPISCQLKRFTQYEALQCLNYHHILFIGDSLSRFQYLSLVYFLEHGHWLSRFRMSQNCTHINEQNVPQCRRPGEVNLNDPFNRNYIDLHVGLGSSYFNGKLECQCHRGRLERSVEDMFYETKTNGNAFKATYLSDNVVFPMKGWNRTFCSKSASCKMNRTMWYEFGEKPWDYVYYGDDPRLYDHLSANVIPDVNIALINRGLWTGIPTNMTSLPIMFKKLSEMVKKNSGRCFWKGTTVPMEPKMSELLGYYPTPSNFSQLERPIRHLSHKYMCESYDLSHVTSEFTDMLGIEYIARLNGTWNSKSRYTISDIYIDRVHFQPWVYEEFNQILLNVLC